MAKKSQNPIIDFSSNVWHGAKLDKLKMFLVENIDFITQYPEKDSESLRKLLARRFELKEKNITVATGTTSAVGLIARAYYGKKSLIVTPCGKKLETICRANNHEIIFEKEPQCLSDINLKDIDLCWISTPNTITGKQWTKRDILKFIDKHPDVIFAVNISYNAYVLEDALKPQDIAKRKNMIVYFSVSKSYNLPGIRLSYIGAPEKIINEIDSFADPYNVNTLAQNAGRYIFVHPAQFVIPIRKWLRNSEELISSLSTTHELEVLPSQTPYFIIQLNRGKGIDLAEYLLKEHNLKVKTSEEICGLDDNCIGISTRSTEENELLSKAIIKWIESK